MAAMRRAVAIGLIAMSVSGVVTAIRPEFGEVVGTVLATSLVLAGLVPAAALGRSLRAVALARRRFRAMAAERWVDRVAPVAPPLHELRRPA